MIDINRRKLIDSQITNTLPYMPLSIANAMALYIGAAKYT